METMTIKDIAKMVGLSVDAIHKIARRDAEFPEMVATKLVSVRYGGRCAKLYDKAAVVEFMRRRGKTTTGFADAGQTTSAQCGAGHSAPLIEAAYARWLVCCQIGQFPNHPRPRQSSPIRYDRDEIMAWRRRHLPRAIDFDLANQFIMHLTNRVARTMEII